MNIKWFIAVFIALVFSMVTNAQSIKQTLTIEDKRFEQPLEFNVHLPKSYQTKSDKQYVVLFDFHPYSHTYLTGLHDWMSHNGEWPWLETIVVNPAYGNPVGQLFDATGNSTPLVNFIADQLLTEIDSQYRTNGYRIFSGFRVNGSIVLSTLLNRPDVFDAYIAISPELKNDYVQILSKSKTAKSLAGKQHKFVLFSHGATIKEDHQMANYQLLNDQLTPYLASHEYHYQDFGQHYFMSLPALSVISAIEAMFSDIHRGLAADSLISQQGVSAIIAHYKDLSANKYGFEVSPKRSIESLGFALLATQPTQGIAVLKENIALYPSDAYTHHALAKAYDQLGDIGNAIKYQTKAAKLAENMLTWHQKRQQRYLQQYQAKQVNLTH